MTLVGLIVSFNETPTRIDYLLDDMTGPPLEVRMFNNDADVSIFMPGDFKINHHDDNVSKSLEIGNFYHSSVFVNTSCLLTPK